MMSMERDINVVVRIARAAKNRAAKTKLAGKAARQTLAAAAAEEDMQ